MTPTFTLPPIPMPVLHRDGRVTLGQGSATLGRWAKLDGPGYVFECRCGASLQRHGKADLRRQAHLHLNAYHRRTS